MVEHFPGMYKALGVTLQHCKEKIVLTENLIEITEKMLRNHCDADQKGAGRRGIQGNGTRYLSFPEDGCHTDKGEHRPSGRAELGRGLCGALFKAAECSVELETQSRVVDGWWGGGQRRFAELCGLRKTFSSPV